MQQSNFHPLMLVPWVRERKVKRKLHFLQQLHAGEGHLSRFTVGSLSCSVAL